MKKRKIKISFAALFVAAQIFSMNPGVAEAFSCSFPGTCTVDVVNEAQEVIDDMQDRFGFDEDILRKAKRKEYAPRVQIFFDIANPKPGEKVTAHAVPEYFKNDTKNLYYSWYIIHTANGTPETALEGDDAIEKGLIEASRVMAKGDYDFNLSLFPGASSTDAKKEVYADERKDPDRDGWPTTDNSSEKNYAPYGGADGVGGLGTETNSQSCGLRGERNVNLCLFTTSDPTALSYYSLSAIQSNYWCNQCLASYADGSRRLPTDDIKNQRNRCCYDISAPTYVDPDSGITYTYEYTSAGDYCAGDAYAGEYIGCYDNFGTGNRQNVESCITSEYNECVDEYAGGNGEITDGATRCYKHKFSAGDETAFGTDDESGLDFPVNCRHKWEDAPDYASGSGKFETGEEKYWQTDPKDPDTDGDGTADEADIIGLGQENFTWVYQAGDRVGVVIEGTSMIPTDELNSYYKIMWAHPDVCDASKEDLIENDGCDDEEDYGFGFMATVAPQEESANEKIKLSLSYSPDNPVADPSSENTDEQGNILDADLISVSSVPENTDADPSGLFYSWFVQKEKSEGEWGSPVDLEDAFLLDGPTDGLGAANLNLTPKKSFFASDDADVVKIKVTVAASRTSSATSLEKEGGATIPRRGFASVEIPINKSGIKIDLYQVETANGKAVLKDKNKICTQGLERTVCPAVSYQMLAAKVSGKKYAPSNSNISWSLNGYPYYPPASANALFEDWTSENSSVVFFPVTKEVQEIENIAATITPKNALLPVSASRIVTVVSPAVFIESADKGTSWPQTTVAEKQDVQYAYDDVVSEDHFEALTDSTASYSLRLVPAYLFSGDQSSQIDWILNGMSFRDKEFYEDGTRLAFDLKTENEDKLVKLETGELENKYFSVGAEVVKFWSEEEKNILRLAWGIEPATLAGSDEITVVTTSSLPAEEEISQKPIQILASLSNSIPHHILYVLRLALTLGVMFFMSSFLYGISQKVSFYDEK